MFACQNNPTCPFSYCPTISQSSTYILEEKMNGDCVVGIVLGDRDVGDNADDMRMRTMQIISEKRKKNLHRILTGCFIVIIIIIIVNGWIGCYPIHWLYCWWCSRWWTISEKEKFFFYRIRTGSFTDFAILVSAALTSHKNYIPFQKHIFPSHFDFSGKL